MIKSFKSFFINYFNFKGKTTKNEFWYAFLTIVLLFSLLGFIFIETQINIDILFLCFIPFLIPTISLSVRRLHDINKSGWHYLLLIIPGIGGFILIIWFCKKSVIENNRF